jgi:hypothetical protein
MHPRDKVHYSVLDYLLDAGAGADSPFHFAAPSAREVLCGAGVRRAEVMGSAAGWDAKKDLSRVRWTLLDAVQRASLPPYHPQHAQPI